MKPSKIVWFASPRGQDKLLYSKALNSVNLLILFYSTFTGQQNMQKMSVQLLVLFRFDGIHFKFVALSEICLSIIKILGTFALETNASKESSYHR